MIGLLLILLNTFQVENSFYGEINFYKKNQKTTLEKNELRYFAKKNSIRLEEEEGEFFLLGESDNVYVLQDINTNIFFEKALFPGNKEIFNILKPGYVWDKVSAIPPDSDQWVKKEDVFNNVEIVTISNSDTYFEEQGFKTTYWLHREYKLPIRRERVVLNEGYPLTDIIEISINKEELSDDLFMAPEGNKNYKITARNTKKDFFLPEEILGIGKQKTFYLNTHKLEEEETKGVFTSYLSEEKDTYIYMVYFQQDLKNENFKIIKKSFDLDLDGWLMDLPEITDGWNLKILSNYPKPILRQHLKTLALENQLSGSGA
ncbi:MAG: hypothetical protein CME22_06955 [Gemmatimonadetes bacterium]|nr:hypothetical protein [Gemmatimonadota bacterium]